MTELYFHCSDAEHLFIGRRSATMDISEAHMHAENMVRVLLMTPGPEDWRKWAVHVTDELGEEIFILPFASVLGQLN